MRYSQFFVPTLKEEPKDAELDSHRLLLRAGLIRQVSSGLFSILPFGQRVMHHISRIIREEMNQIGALEVALPFVIPAELWQKSERWDVYGKELLRFKDRLNRDCCLGPTHEEVITQLASDELFSYKQLPLALYQIQPKFRDEIRPRFGLMRAREFLMKDAYSFHLNKASLDETYEHFKRAYESIFKRFGLDMVLVEADSGAIGGDQSAEFMLRCDVGENTIISCDDSAWAANDEIATCIKGKRKAVLDQNQELSLVETPDQKSIEDVASFFGCNLDDVLKARLYKKESGGFVLCLVEGDRQVNEIKLSKVFAPERILAASDEEIERVSGAKLGFLGPLELKEPCEIVLDDGIDEGPYVVGANQTDCHYKGFSIASLNDVRVADISFVLIHKDASPKTGKVGSLRADRAIELGHVFQLGQKYAKAMGASVLDQNGKSSTLEMGCYGIGVGRSMAAIAQVFHDEKGLIWPLEVAPFKVIILCLSIKDQAILEASEQLYKRLKDVLGDDVLLDDRKESPGRKFADADLLGIPIQLVLGKSYLNEKRIECRLRATQETEALELEAVEGFVEKNLSLEHSNG